LADNLFEQPKVKEKRGKTLAFGKVDFTVLDQGELAKEPLSLLSLSGIDVRKAIAEARKPTAEEIATSSPVSRLRAEHGNKPEMLVVGKEVDSLKSIYEDGILKLYDEPGKSHFGFKFLDPSGTNNERLSVGAVRKERLEDLLGNISLQYRFKF
jgi:hypothetical protein